jgi:hypothetical protein
MDASLLWERACARKAYRKCCATSSTIKSHFCERPSQTHAVRNSIAFARKRAPTNRDSNQRHCLAAVSNRHFINAIASHNENAIEFATVIEGNFIKMP